MIRLFVIEDHHVIISGLRNIFRPSRDHIEITITASGISDALRHAPTEPFDIILLDLWLHEPDPESNFKKVKNQFPGKPIVIYTHEQLFLWQRKMFRIGANGYIIKTAEKSEIKSIFEQVMQGNTVYSTAMNQFNAKRNIFESSDNLFGLSTNQEQIIQLLSDGYSLKEIANKLCRSTSTIEKTLKEVRQKLNANTNFELVKILLLRNSN
jgi:DNA-binding NarL/FixJ family response regulator